MRRCQKRRNEFPDGALEMEPHPVIRRHMTLAFPLLVAGALTLAAGATTANAQTARVTGRVTDMVDGEPIGGVSITLRNTDTGLTVQLTSKDDGSYFRRALPIGRFEITFEKEGYVPARDSRRLGSGQTTHNAVLEPTRAAPPGSSPEYIAAYTAFEAGDLPQTIEVLTALLGDQPDFGPGHLLLARSHYELEHWEEAIVGYKRVIELEPEIPVAYLDLGVALSAIGELDDASKYFEKAVSMQPDDATAYYNIGAIFIRADRVDEAIEYLTRSTEIDPEQPLAHKALAFALVRKQDTARAAVHLERYLEIEPAAADAAEMLALLEQLRGS